MINLILFGKPGSGKGTQSDILKDKYKLVHISTGDIFRKNVQRKTKLGVLSKTYMDKGNLVPDEVTIGMIKNEIKNYKTPNGFIFDGFPRTTVQANVLDKFLKSKKMIISATIALEVDEELLIERLLKRGQDSGRSDDLDKSKIENRFSEYNKKTAPLITYYKNQNKFNSVDGTGTLAEITERLCFIIDSL